MVRDEVGYLRGFCKNCCHLPNPGYLFDNSIESTPTGEGVGGGGGIYGVLIGRGNAGGHLILDY